jgi:endonuclease G, mitochondrial
LRRDRRIFGDEQTSHRASVLILILLMVSVACGQEPFEGGLPAGGGGEIVAHTGFVLCYAERFEQASWAAYMLTRAEVESDNASRKSLDFTSDPAVTTGSATKDDYRRSGYDKGHLIPAADMKWSAKAMHDCFYLSNISPQLHAFNAGIWEELEEDVRGWAETLVEISVVTGPVLKSGLPTIGADRVAIPELFYKVILYRGGSEPKAIGFVMPNTYASGPVTRYAVTVDSVETLTGLDLFPALPPAVQEQAESRIDTRWWFAAGETKHRTRRHK